MDQRLKTVRMSVVFRLQNYRRCHPAQFAVEFHVPKGDFDEVLSRIKDQLDSMKKSLRGNRFPRRTTGPAEDLRSGQEQQDAEQVEQTGKDLQN